MESFIHSLFQNAETITRFMLQWSWQVLILLSCLWLYLSLSRKRPATQRYNLWLYGLLAALMLPVLSSLLKRWPWIFQSSLPTEPSGGVFIPMIRNALQAIEPSQTLGFIPSAPDPLPTPSLSKVLWVLVFVAWVTRVLVSLAQMARLYLKYYNIRRRARIVPVAALCGVDNERVGIPVASTPIGLTSKVRSPVLVGLFRPTILLPADIISWSDEQERVSILRHELAHVRRLDHYHNFFQGVLCAVFFFHPLIRFACRQLSLEREIACDDSVIALGSTPTIYAESILKVAERNIAAEASHQPASYASRQTLQRRIDMIMSCERETKMKQSRYFVLLGVGVLAAVMTIFLAANSQASASSQPVGEAGVPVNWFAGTWKNIDEKTRGITRVEIKVEDSKVKAHPWGSCVPDECDMGVQDAVAFGPSVDADISKTTKLLRVAVNGHKERLLIIRLLEHDRLQVEAIDQFLDGSGRTDYAATWTFARSSK